MKICLFHIHPRFDCKLKASLFDLHGPSFVSSILYSLLLWTYSYLTKPVLQSWCHLTQGTRRATVSFEHIYLVADSKTMMWSSAYYLEVTLRLV